MLRTIHLFAKFLNALPVALLCCGCIHTGNLKTIEPEKNQASMTPTTSLKPSLPFVIFPKEKKAFEGTLGYGHTYWTPSENEAGVAEQKIKTYIRERHAKIFARYEKYRVQIVGVETKDVGRIIYANYFCHSSFDWRAIAIDVDDGGDCYFQIKYCLNTDKCFDMSINGEA